MPQLVYSAGAIRGLSRCVKFLARHDRDAARRAATAIDARVAQLRVNAMIGRPVKERSDLRELVIRFGRSGYIALYRYDTSEDMVRILAFRHQREAGY